jgi:hypothetical protein
MRATCHVARYFHVVGLVGQDKPRKLAPVHQPPEGFRVGRAAADNAMGAKLERVAGIGDRDCAGRWRQGALLDPLAVKDDLINLLEFESEQARAIRICPRPSADKQNVAEPAGGWWS